MANPRQRRKARSSSHRPVSHSRHAMRNLKKQPPIKGPKLLQQNWDKTKTVRQNYAALGLAHNLNPNASGGSDHSQVIPAAQSSANAHAASSNDASKTSTIRKGQGKIIRDEAGNVIDIELAEGDDDEVHGGEDETMEDLAPEIPDAVRSKWITALGGEQNEDRSDGTVVKSLEEISATKGLDPSKPSISASISGVGPRHASGGEVRYLQRLIEKYGRSDTGIEKMARDRKLNSQQRTKAQLVKALQRAGLYEASA